MTAGELEMTAGTLEMTAGTLEMTAGELEMTTALPQRVGKRATKSRVPRSPAGKRTDGFLVGP